MQNLITGVTATVCVIASNLAVASQQDESQGFIEGAKASIKLRNMYMNRNFRQEGAAQNHAEEWAQGFLGVFESGFTQGTVGVGVDLIGKLGLKLDTGDGRTGGGTGLLEQDNNGAKDSYSTGGAALKVRVSNTTFKYGTQLVALPVFTTSDTRLLPEFAEGFSVTSAELSKLQLNAGHFTALNNRNQSTRDSNHLTSLDYAGGIYKFTPQLSSSLYYSRVDDHFRKYYASTTYSVPLSENQSLTFDFNGYDTKSEGRALSGTLDNNIWSFSTVWAVGAHKFQVGYQQVNGTGGYVYGADGASTIYLGNSLQYSDFNYEDEKSWQARYDLNLAPFGVPGLTFMVRYVKGYDFNTTQTSNGQAWERDTEARYVVQSGPAKNLSFRVRHASYRSSDQGGQVDDLRVITEYPLNIF